MLLTLLAVVMSLGCAVADGEPAVMLGGGAGIAFDTTSGDGNCEQGSDSESCSAPGKEFTSGEEAGADEDLGPFVPTYEFQAVRGRAIPAGLQVKASLNGFGSMARIPARWKMDVACKGKRVRLEVERGRMVGAVRAELARSVEMKRSQLVLTGDGDEMPDHLTVEKAELFGKKMGCRLAKK